VSGKPEVDRDNLLVWTTNLLKRLQITPAVVFDPPDRRLFQIHHRDGDRDVFFLTNQDGKRTLSFNTRFNTGDKIPWVWDPHTGDRCVFPHGAQPSVLSIRLDPFQSMLLVFEPKLTGPSVPPRLDEPQKFVNLEGSWQVTLEPIIGQRSQLTIDRLIDFGTSDDPVLSTFAGTAVYRTRFEAPDGATVLDLGEVADISEVTLNGKPLGVRWFGRHVYEIGQIIVPGENTLEIKITSVLYNYCHSLKDNRTARSWTNRSREPAPVGLLGSVRIGFRR
jgi:hypothetical protein